MSAIRYDLDAEAAIRQAVTDRLKFGAGVPYQLGAVEAQFQLLAARATLESQPAQIAARIESRMDLDAEMAARFKIGRAHV